MTCTKTENCPAEVHYAGCLKVRTQVLRAETLRECQRWGHSWDVISTPVGPVRLVCEGCGKSYRVVPEKESHDV